MKGIMVDTTPKRRTGIERLFRKLVFCRYNKKRKDAKLDDYLGMHSREVFKRASTEVYYELMETMFDDEKAKLVGCESVNQFCGDLLP